MSPIFTVRKLERHAPGQSLVEFILVMPLLVLIMLGGFFMGFNFHQVQMASSAVQQVAMNKLSMARQPGAVTTGVLQGYINASPTSGSGTTGALIDNVSITAAGQYVTVVQGKKQTQGWPGVIPGLNISAPQVVNANLLLPANAGAVVRSTAAWTGPPPYP